MYCLHSVRPLRMSGSHLKCPMGLKSVGIRFHCKMEGTAGHLGLFWVRGVIVGHCVV